MVNPHPDILSFPTAVVEYPHNQFRSPYPRASRFTLFTQPTRVTDTQKVAPTTHPQGPNTQPLSFQMMKTPAPMAAAPTGTYQGTGSGSGVRIRRCSGSRPGTCIGLLTRSGAGTRTGGVRTPKEYSIIPGEVCRNSI